MRFRSGFPLIAQVLPMATATSSLQPPPLILTLLAESSRRVESSRVEALLEGAQRAEGAAGAHVRVQRLGPWGAPPDLADPKEVL